MRLTLLTLPMILSLPFLLTGCPAAVAGGAAVGGTAVAQERPVGDAVGDAAIRIELNKLYIQKDAGDMFKNISIEVMEGRVLLVGSVVRADTARQAADLARGVDGVKEVLNEIQVTGGTGIKDYALDSWISTQVKTRMLLERGFRSINFNIQTVNQVVYILGIARDAGEREKATTIASTTKYVQKVVSHIILADDPRRAANRKKAPAQINNGTNSGTYGNYGNYDDYRNGATTRTDGGTAPTISNDSYDATRPDSSWGQGGGGAAMPSSGGVTPGGVTSQDLPPPTR